jgi:hypothetical protein
MAQSIQLTLLNGATTTGDGAEDRAFDKSMDVLQSSVRDAGLFRDHAGAGLL